ncbi:hypothetical protein [Streptomyces sp. NPDC002346]
MKTSATNRLRRITLRLGAGAVIGALLGAVAAQAAQPAAAVADSTVTVSGRGEFKDMRFTVSQTTHLTNQAVSVSWTGGRSTAFAGALFNTDFVQIMQCWGDDDGTVTGNPGPSRTQCQYGASPTTNRGGWPGNAYDDTRSVTYSADPSNYGQDDSYGAGGAFGQGEVPFKSVDGTVITKNTQNNPMFNYNTTNEVDFARTSSDGTGQEFFEVQTANEAPHLGCGVPVTKAGVTTPRSCWLVIVPQGHLDLDGQPYADRTQVNAGSPVSSTNWKNRVAFKLGFNSVASNCALGADERATTGSELAADAMTSWQAALCPTGTVYGYTKMGEPDARARLSRDGETGLAFTTRALGDDPGTTAPDGLTTYAPVALSGAVIGFTIERRAKAGAPESTQKISGTKVQSISLTPRLVAKLLTESYRGSVWGSVVTRSSGGTSTPEAAKGYQWAVSNPAGLVTDPEFLALNPEFAHLSVAETPATDTDLITTLGHSDTARTVWQWIASDKDARDFLAGAPDKWGMHVNPYFSTSAAVNPTGLAFELARDDFPKSDPWCLIPAETGVAGKQCMTDFHPYVDDMHAGALSTRRADTLWKSYWDALAVPPAYKSVGPQIVGSRFVISITDAASAARYSLQSAKLRNAAGKFTAPTVTTLTTAAAGAAGDTVHPVDPAGAKAKDAYPLAQLVYGAVRPAALTAGARKDYARLLNYAAGLGQTTGSDPGDLPPGYAPLSTALRTQARQAATVIANWKGQSSAGDPTDDPAGGGAGSSGGAGTSAGTGSSGVAGASGAGGTGKPGSPAPSAAASFGGGAAVETTANGITPGDPSSSLRYAIPIGAALGAAAAIGAPFAGGSRLRLPLRLPLPGGRSVTVLPRLTLPRRLRLRP